MTDDAETADNSAHESTTHRFLRLVCAPRRNRELQPTALA
jgi:hypothetical protein